MARKYPRQLRTQRIVSANFITFHPLAGCPGKCRSGSSGERGVLQSTKDDERGEAFQVAEQKLRKVHRVEIPTAKGLRSKPFGNPGDPGYPTKGYDGRMNSYAYPVLLSD
eukprot:2474894-Rhodomonas_salina.2